jgi:hypothetical protein
MKRILARIVLTELLLAMLVGCNSPTTKQAATEQVPQVIAGNEMAAIARLRSIATAEMQYQFDSGGSYATLDELIKNRMISDLSEAKLNGYRFDVRVRPGRFEATAVPVRFGITGKRSFYVDESRIMRGADKRGDQAVASDPEV